MLKNIFLWILQNVFKVNTQTTQKEVDDNQKYAAEYERIDDINFNSIFSNKLANYVINDSNVNITGENARVEFIRQNNSINVEKSKENNINGIWLWWSYNSAICKRW